MLIVFCVKRPSEEGVPLGWGYRTARIFNLRCLANKVTPKTWQMKWKGNKFEQAINQVYKYQDQPPPN